MKTSRLGPKVKRYPSIQCFKCEWTVMDGFDALLFCTCTGSICKHTRFLITVLKTTLRLCKIRTYSKAISSAAVGLSLPRPGPSEESSKRGPSLFARNIVVRWCVEGRMYANRCVVCLNGGRQHTFSLFSRQSCRSADLVAIPCTGT